MTSGSIPAVLQTNELPENCTLLPSPTPTAATETEEQDGNSTTGPPGKPPNDSKRRYFGYIPYYPWFQAKEIDPPPCPCNCKRSCSLQLQFPVTGAMGPDANLVAYTTLPSGEVVVDSAPFKVSDILENKVGSVCLFCMLAGHVPVLPPHLCVCLCVCCRLA